MSRNTIHLIVEDKTDGDVVKAFLKALKIDVRVNVLIPIGNTGGISRLVKDLDRHIQTVRSKLGANDCIAVLHDADEQVQPDRSVYKRIENICKQNSDVAEVIAYDEIEAWLLADEGLCSWLGIKAQNCDKVRHPSHRLNSLVKDKIKRDYSGSDRQKVLEHLTGISQSPSFQEALEHLTDAPCTK